MSLGKKCESFVLERHCFYSNLDSINQTASISAQNVSASSNPPKTGVSAG